ncbi:MAG: DHA2 family efflux MFS transporter permease subunit [Desulfobacteraceae bacterium]|nr:DHA2 family efflux MFS transporter permease subunit [Desulfobacteraceae bacterium]
MKDDAAGEAPVYEEISNLFRGIFTIIVMTGSFMAILDTTVVDVVVPKMMAPLSTDLYGIQWVITAYMTAAAVGLLLTYNLGSAWGLKRLFLAGLLVFTIASASCGLAQSLSYMIFSRAVQGFGEAFIMASAQTILFSIYPPKKRGLAMGIYALGVSFAPSLGPVVGGWVTENLNWRWVFYINLPVGIMNFVAGAILLPEVLKEKGVLRFNYFSYAMLASFTISLLILLSRGQQEGWFQSLLIVCLAIGSAVALCLFLISELLSKKSLIDFSIFKIKEYSLSMGFYFLVMGLSIYQLFYLLPLYYENVKHLTTFQTGLHMLAFAIFIAIFSPLAGYLSDRIGPIKIITASMTLYLCTSFFLIPSLNYYTPSIKAAIITIPLGISLGTFFAPVSALSLSHLGKRTGLGVSLMHYLRFVGGSLGTAIATNTLEWTTAQHYQEIGVLQDYRTAHKFVQGISLRLSGLFPKDAALIKAKALLASVQGLQASSFAFQDTFRDGFFYACTGCIFLAALIISSSKDNIHKTHKT